MAELTGNHGFAPPRAEQTLSKRHMAALELIATVALAVSLVVAATVAISSDCWPAAMSSGARCCRRRWHENKPNSPYHDQ